MIIFAEVPVFFFLAISFSFPEVSSSGIFIKKEPCKFTLHREMRARSDWRAVEENQTNYFEHAAFSKMGLRLFSRLDIIPSRFSFYFPPALTPSLSLLFHREGFINRLRTRADAQETALGQDFARYLPAATARAALRKLVPAVNRGNHRQIMNCLDTRD